MTSSTPPSIATSSVASEIASSTGAPPLRVFVIAGEASGDRLGAALMRGLREECARPVDFMGVGGAAMASEGLESLFPLRDIAVMGVAEVAPKLPVILRRLRLARDAAIQYQPDAVVTIDAPAFGLRVSQSLRRRLGPKPPLFHFVAPSVWAWRPKRAQHLAGFLDHLLALLPFEPPYFQRVGLSCDFVGHPIVESAAPAFAGDWTLRAELDIPTDAPVVVALPGSRAGEIRRLAPIFGEAIALLRQKVPGLHVLAPLAENVAELAAEAVSAWPGPVHAIDPRGLEFDAAEQRKFRAMAAADAALAASGSVSLELAATRTPMVIAYRVNRLTAAIVRRLRLINTATLVNLVASDLPPSEVGPGDVVVPEFLQENCRPDLMAAAVARLLDRDDPARERQRLAAEKTLLKLGAGDLAPSRRAARSLLAALARASGDGAESSADATPS